MSDQPEDVGFQSVKDGKPIRDNNILIRFIKPAARSLDLGWINWRSLRTSHAVWLKMAGADVKDAQGQMRHSRASTTLDIYQQFVPERKPAASSAKTKQPKHQYSLNSGRNCSQLQPRGDLRDLQVIENMVARDGVEPPTPAFSVCEFHVPTTT